MTALRPIIIKEFRQVARDRRTLGIFLFMPAFMLVMFGYALNFDVKHLPLTVLDQDRTSASRALLEHFKHSEYFDIKDGLSNSNEVDTFALEKEGGVALIIPPGFGGRLLAGKDNPLQVIIDGSNATTASAAVGYINAILLDYSKAILSKAMMRAGRPAPSFPIDVRPRVWYNPELRSAFFLVPGLIAFIMLIASVVSTALSIVREKERGTMEQIAVSPVTPLGLILGKIIPYIVISLGAAAATLLAGYVLFDVSVRGSLWLLLFVTILFLVAGLGMGLFISTIADTQQVAFQVAALATMLPTFILSGFVFPIKNMPLVIQAVTFLVPARYFLKALRSIILKGVGIEAFWEQCLFLVAFGAIVMAVSSFRLARRT